MNKTCNYVVGVAVAVVSALMMQAANAGITRIDEGAFLPGAGHITFSEFPVGTTNPAYAPADYGGDASEPNVTFAGWFEGQSLSANPSVDCPGAASTGCVVGTPTGPLSLDTNSPDTFITGDGAQPTSPILSGGPDTYNGPIAILFSEGVAGVGLDGGYFDAANSTKIEAFDENGNSLGFVTNNGTGVEFLGLVTDDKSESIRGLLFSLVGDEPAGFDIDNVRFGAADQIVTPPTGVPEPGELGMFGLGALLIGLFAGLRRRLG